MNKCRFQFLRACLRGDREAVQLLLREPGWAWESLLQDAMAEAVLPALAGLVGDLAPKPIAGFLAQVEAANRERNRTIMGELKSALALLNEAGIEPVLLKGAAYLALGVYSDIAHRYMVDVDLLVSEEQLPVAVGILLRAGYIEEDRDAWGRFRHHHPPLKSPGSVSFEIHRRMGLPRCEKVLTAREVIARSVPHNFDGLRARVPCPEHLMAHLIVHSQLQSAYNERIWPPLRALWDLVLLERRFGAELDWEAVRARFKACGQYRPMALHLMRVEETLKPGLQVQLRTDWATRALWLRRQAIRRHAWLRYADPVYMFATVLGRRLALLRKLPATREGMRHVLAQTVAVGNYTRLWTDLTEGRGR